MKKRGFTLIELIIVVIIVGILATLAIPQYTRAVERAKFGKARHALGLIASAEKMYHAETPNEYLQVAAAANLNDDPGLGGFVELADVVTDAVSGDWDCTVDPATAGAFTAQCSRRAGTYVGCIVSLDQDGAWSTASGATCVAALP